MTAIAPPSRIELRDHLLRTGIAGHVATPRDSNIRNYRRLAEMEWPHTFGLRTSHRWTFPEILALMAVKCGVDPDPTRVDGGDTIDPDRTIDALDVMAARIAVAARRRSPVILATGHPAGLLPIYLALAGALRERGCPVLTPAAGWLYHPPGRRQGHIRYLDGVAMLSVGGGLTHLHDPEPMEAMLAELRGADAAWPKLAIADHGWAGAAGEAGIDTVGFADSNDPALFVGESEDKIAVAVPLDDNVFPQHYAPLVAYLLTHAGLTS